MKFLLAVLLMAAPCCAQTWVKIANEGDTLITSSQVTVRYGSPNCGTAGCWATLTATGTIAANNATFGDPAPNQVKELDILQTAAAQMVTVNGTQLTVSGSSTSTFAGMTSASTTAGSITTQPVTAILSYPSCTIPKNGGTCKFPVVTVPGQTVALPATSGTFSFTCTGPDMQHLSCTAVRQ